MNNINTTFSFIWDKIFTTTARIPSIVGSLPITGQALAVTGVAGVVFAHQKIAQQFPDSSSIPQKIAFHATTLSLLVAPGIGLGLGAGISITDTLLLATATAIIAIAVQIFRSALGLFPHSAPSKKEEPKKEEVKKEGEPITKMLTIEDYLNRARFDFEKGNYDGAIEALNHTVGVEKQKLCLEFAKSCCMLQKFDEANQFVKIGDLKKEEIYVSKDKTELKEEPKEIKKVKPTKEILGPEVEKIFKENLQRLKQSVPSLTSCSEGTRAPIWIDNKTGYIIGIHAHDRSPDCFDGASEEYLKETPNSGYVIMGVLQKEGKKAIPFFIMHDAIKGHVSDLLEKPTFKLQINTKDPEFDTWSPETKQAFDGIQLFQKDLIENSKKEGYIPSLKVTDIKKSLNLDDTKSHEENLDWSSYPEKPKKEVLKSELTIVEPKKEEPKTDIESTPKLSKNEQNLIDAKLAFTKGEYTSCIKLMNDSYGDEKKNLCQEFAIACCRLDKYEVADQFIKMDYFLKKEEIYLFAAEKEFEEGNLDKAFAIANQAEGDRSKVARSTGYFKLCLKISQAYLAKEELDKAYDALPGFIEPNEKVDTILSVLAYAYEEKENLLKAMECSFQWSKPYVARHLDRSKSFYIELAKAFLEKNDFANAKEVIERGILGCSFGVSHHYLLIDQETGLKVRKKLYEIKDMDVTKPELKEPIQTMLKWIKKSPDGEMLPSAYDYKKE